MSDVIRLLPDSVANQIAAGEVIQRPASVIKELVENAVDAGASTIKILLRDGGKNLIQVIDDGCGMSDTDARMAFERHATSKIKQAADLFELHTMGFRGEALPSIAAVAQIDLRTMRHDDSVGTHLEIAASRVESQTPEACAPGTNIAVKNLFFNFPARRKFLKKDAVELNHIVHEFERLALVNPDKEFLLVHNDVTLHQLTPGSLKQRIANLFGKGLDKQLIPVATETSLVKINGFVSLPQHCRKRNALQYFFVNGRNMRHPYFQRAVLHCFEDLIPADQQPNFFLNFEVDPQTIDVNIHPTKNEIKFENEVPIWQIIVAAVKEALGKFNAVPSIDFDRDDAIDIPAFVPGGRPTSVDSVSTSHNHFNDFSRQSSKPSASVLDNWEKLYHNFQAPSADGLGIETRESALNIERTSNVDCVTPDRDKTHEMLLPEMSSVENAGLLQLAGRYIVVPNRDGAMIIDRHRAHLKVLYEQFIKDGFGQQPETQQILFPETVSLDPSQSVTLESVADAIEAMGFELSYLGDNVWAINGVPAVLGKQNPVEALVNIIDDVAQGMGEPGANIQKTVALAMARSAAIRAGQPMTDEEADALLARLFSLPNPNYTPDGNQIIAALTTQDIASRLK